MVEITKEEAMLLRKLKNDVVIVKKKHTYYADEIKSTLELLSKIRKEK